jgi:hypothetical protein
VLLTKTHLTLHVIAGVLMAVAGAAAFQTKRVFEKPHFRSVHSWAALATSSFFLLNILQGLVLTLEKTPRNWQWKDETHVLVGTLVYIGQSTPFEFVYTETVSIIDPVICLFEYRSRDACAWSLHGVVGERPSRS